MKQILLLFILIAASSQLACSQQKNTSDQEAVRQVVQKQEQAWNNYDLDEFMEGYWKSDSLIFVGSQITKGWAPTLERYRQRYIDKSEMGELKFDILRIAPLTTGVYVVTGTYFIVRTTDNLSGTFTLLFQKKNNKWVIVYDHTSA